MRYCLLMHYEEGPSLGMTEEDMAPAMAAFAAYADDLSAAGVLITTEVLDSVAHDHHRDGARRASPRFRTARSRTPRRSSGGIFVIDVADLDEALTWARRNPANGWGSVEIRPVARTYAADRGWFHP